MVGSSRPISASRGARLLGETSSDGGFLKSIGFSGLASDFGSDLDEEATDGRLATDDDDVDDVAAGRVATEADLTGVLVFNEDADFFGDFPGMNIPPRASAKLVPIELSISSISSSEPFETTASSFGFLADASDLDFERDEDDSCFRLSEWRSDLLLDDFGVGLSEVISDFSSASLLLRLLLFL